MRGVGKVSELNEKQRKLYDLLVGQYRMKPARALAAVAIRGGNVGAVGLAVGKEAPIQPWVFSDGWVLNCKCKAVLVTGCAYKGEAATAAVEAGWVAKDLVVRCPACRAALR